MNDWIIQLLITVVSSVLASSAFWAFFDKCLNKKDARNRIVVGLAHDRIVHLGMSYIERGWITEDEYENLNDYLYIPYEKMGGNGSAKKVMSEVRKLPMHKADYAGIVN